MSIIENHRYRGTGDVFCLHEEKTIQINHVFSVEEKYTESVVIFSNHSFLRASQRGINPEMIMNVLNYGEIVNKQGLAFYTIPKPFLDTFPPQLIKKLRNIVVVMSEYDDIIITCYKAKNAIKHLKRKSKTFYQDYGT